MSVLLTSLICVPCKKHHRQVRQIPIVVASTDFDTYFDTAARCSTCTSLNHHNRFQNKVKNLHNAVRHVADCLVAWPNNFHSPVVSQHDFSILTLLERHLRPLPHGGQVFALRPHQQTLHRRFPCQPIKVGKNAMRIWRHHQGRREASDARARVYHSATEDSKHPADLVRRNLVHDTLLRSHKSKASGDQISSRGRQLIHERRRADGKREFEFQQLHEQPALRH